jgi:hypothetical protein
MMFNTDAKTKIDALKLLRQFHENNGNTDKVNEIDEQLSTLVVEEPVVEEPVKKPTRKRQKTK